MNGPRVFKLKNQERYKERVFREVMENELQYEKRNGNATGILQLFNSCQCNHTSGFYHKIFKS